jgi:RNA polymerase sigma factor (sigma-70 family)
MKQYGLSVFDECVLIYPSEPSEAAHAHTILHCFRASRLAFGLLALCVLPCAGPLAQDDVAAQIPLSYAAASDESHGRSISAVQPSQSLGQRKYLFGDWDGERRIGLLLPAAGDPASQRALRQSAYRPPLSFLSRAPESPGQSASRVSLGDFDMTQFVSSRWCGPNAGDASSFTEATLVAAAQAGQDWALVELCYRHSKRILFTLYKITKNREDAEDAFQESILKAFTHLSDFNQNSTFATWFTRISINSALMILRRKRARPEISTDATTSESVGDPHWQIADRNPNPEDHYIHHENEERLHSAISNLPERYRRIFEIRRRSDGSLKQIAEEAGITIGATKSRLMRARRALHSSTG